MAVWIPVAKALRRFGPIIGPIVVEKARREARPYWQAYQHARRIDGHLGAWEDETGKHWVVLSADGNEIVGAFPTMSREQRRTALSHLDPAHLQHHTETVLHKLGTAPSRVREALPGRRGEED